MKHEWGSLFLKHTVYTGNEIKSETSCVDLICKLNTFYKINIFNALRATVTIQKIEKLLCFCTCLECNEKKNGKHDSILSCLRFVLLLDTFFF